MPRAAATHRQASASSSPSKRTTPIPPRASRPSRPPSSGRMPTSRRRHQSRRCRRHRPLSISNELATFTLQDESTEKLRAAANGATCARELILAGREMQLNHRELPWRTDVRDPARATGSLGQAGRDGLALLAPSSFGPGIPSPSLRGSSLWFKSRCCRSPIAVAVQPRVAQWPVRSMVLPEKFSVVTSFPPFSDFTYDTSIQIWSGAIALPHAGIPSGRPW